MKSNEVAGAGNHNTALFWEYDTRLGRRWNLDPVKNSLESPYAALNNSPIAKNDINGDVAVLALAPEAVAGLFALAATVTYVYAQHQRRASIDWDGASEAMRRSWKSWHNIPRISPDLHPPTVDGLAQPRPFMLPATPFVKPLVIPHIEVLTDDRVREENNKAFYHITYQMTDKSGHIYIGRTSGYGTPTEIARKRASRHHMLNKGFIKESVTPLTAVKSWTGDFDSRYADPAYWFTRGAEHYQIKYYESAGISGNTAPRIGQRKSDKSDTYRDTYESNKGETRDGDNCVNCGVGGGSVQLQTGSGNNPTYGGH